MGCRGRGGVAAMVGSGAKGGSPTIGHPFNFFFVVVVVVVVVFFFF
jgi:hypothetical protein